MYRTNGQQDTEAFGNALGALLQSGDTVLMYGSLGAGKSVLARGCARAQGVTEAMASPTFTLMQPYQGKSCPVYHFDLYRLESEDELFATGLQDELGGNGISLVEWPQQADVCPPCRVEIDIERDENAFETRLLQVACFGMKENRVNAIYKALAKWEA